MDYGFNFDKIALHLYYQFPQYEQKITYKTVAFRWWQITAQKMNEEKNMKNQHTLKNTSQA